MARVPALRVVLRHVVQAEVTLGEVERVFGVLKESGGARNRWGVLKGCYSCTSPFLSSFRKHCVLILIWLFKSGIETLKQTIANVGTAVWTAREKQTETKEECREQEKDMDEFKNNKEGKIEELKVSFFVFFLPFLPLF